MRTLHGGGFFLIGRLPVSESLGSAAILPPPSDPASERRTGARRLGGVTRSPLQDGFLNRLQDPESTVLEIAVWSLGLAGDAVVRKILNPNAAPTEDLPLPRAAMASIGDLDLYEK